ncbi:MAG: hypothetical protein MJ095_04805, partial [Oscillospiraceae bacterium]|nr:hypothetical protein [Oscillospiraceae bacterium]
MWSICDWKKTMRSVTALLISAGMIALMCPSGAIGVNADTGSSGVEPESGPHGSGSYQLNEEKDHNRFYTEYFVEAEKGKSTTSAGIERRTSVKVYAKAGEIILFGSSVANSQIDADNKYVRKATGADIVITTPDGKKIVEDVLLPKEKEADGTVRPNGLGYIKNPTQEKYGPMVNHADEKDPENKYYVPLRYTVEQEGVYVFEFHSVTGLNPVKGSGYHPSPVKTGDAWKQGNTSVAAWDVTVLGRTEDAKWEVKSGRAWADYLALTTAGGAGIHSDLDVHVLSHDGYQYKVNFEEAVPYGFIFFANNTGFMSAEKDEDTSDTVYHPVYHSFYDQSNDLDNMETEENIYLHKPNQPDTDTLETYKVFFNRPSPDLDGFEYQGDKIKTEPDEEVVISDLKFLGLNNRHNVAYAGHGGHFTFESNGEAMVTIRLDLRKAIFESEDTMDAYEGSGFVELTAPAVKGFNSVYWDGKDTDAVTLPAGIYGNNNVVISTEIKRGELHFPVIDMEGLHEGLTVERINGDKTGTDECFNLYYNNNPLAYGTIEGEAYSKVIKNNFNILSDGTKSFNVATQNGGLTFFKYDQKSVSTLVKDDKDYLANKLFGEAYSELSADRKSLIDAEFGREQDTFHFEPVDSRKTSMKFDCKEYVGGGDKAGIDAWTYYSQGVTSNVISFALMGSEKRGMVSGKVFFDENVSASEDAGDYPLKGIKVRLLDKDGVPLVHNENLPCFDDKGHFIYDENGKVRHEEQEVEFAALTDSTGTYRFTGVPYNPSEDTTYYAQVMLTDVQSEVLHYACTTSETVRTNYKTADNKPFIAADSISDKCGADGNEIETIYDSSRIYKHGYHRDKFTNNTVFDISNAQCITFSAANAESDKNEIGIRTEYFKMIGYGSTVPSEYQKDYKLVKKWGTDSHGLETHHISDGLTVELWVWNDEGVREEHSFKTNRRTGALVDTQVLNAENNWTYTWKSLDDRLQYYVLEYYTKKKPNGEVIHDDRGEAKKVLIGGTMPLFSTVSDKYASTGIYGFETDLGEYPEPDPVEYPAGSGKHRIPIQKFSENGKKTHASSITKTEKLEAVDNNARQYDVTYTLSTENGGRTNVINLSNSQEFDDRAYYVWLNHDTELPDMVAQTYVEDGTRKSHALPLERDMKHQLDDGYYCIKGLSVSSLDAANVDNTEGNATSVFRISEDGKQSAMFTPTRKIYTTGTGTRTYRVKYVVNSHREPVSVSVNGAGALVLSDDHSVTVEDNSNYTVYSWIMTIHVYDVVSDGVIEYDPKAGPVKLQEALNAGDELNWTLMHNASNDYAVIYESNDHRSSGILHNDTYRVPLYKEADEYDMGSCADLVGIAYAGHAPVDDVSKLVFEDTYETRYGIKLLDLDDEIGSDDGGAAGDGTAAARGSRGVLTASLNVPRDSRINRKQDHANYAEVVFTPDRQSRAAKTGISTDVFYYKVVVFAEDNTYQYSKYEDIDASEGVVMYTYFSLKPTEEPEEEQPEVTTVVTTEVTTEVTTNVTSEITKETTTKVTTVVPEVITTRVTTEAPKEVTTKVTTEAPKPVTTNVITEVPKEVTTKVTTEASKPVTTNVITEVPKEVTAKVTTEASKPVTTNVITEVPKEVTAKVTTEAPKPVTTNVITEVPKEVTSRVTTEAPKEVTAKVTTEAPGEVTTKVTTEVPKEVTTKITSEASSEVTPETTTVVPGDVPPEETTVVPGDVPPEETTVVPGDVPPEETTVVPGDVPPEETTVVPGDVPP